MRSCVSFRAGEKIQKDAEEREVGVGVGDAELGASRSGREFEVCRFLGVRRIIRVIRVIRFIKAMVIF